jgi:hypothetical protein
MAKAMFGSQQKTVSWLREEESGRPLLHQHLRIAREIPRHTHPQTTSHLALSHDRAGFENELVTLTVHGVEVNGMGRIQLQFLAQP